MEVYVTEEQQVEAIKKWFKKYGNRLSWGIIFVCLIVLATLYWRHHQEVIREQASDQYIALLESLAKKDDISIKTKADILLNQYRSSPYATLASFILALDAITRNDLSLAEQHLRWVINHRNHSHFPEIAEVRLMRLLIDQNKLAEALKLYDEKLPDGFLTLMAELKGDILLKQDKIDEAKKAYELAYQSAPGEGMHGPLLKMKMEALNIEPSPQPEEKAVDNEAKKS